VNDTVVTEVNGRVLVTLNRPDARNALDSSLAQGLLAAYERLDADGDLATGVLAGAPGSVRAWTSRRSRPPGLRRASTGCSWDQPASPLSLRRRVRARWRSRAGPHADLIVAAHGARFGIPEVKGWTVRRRWRTAPAAPRHPAAAVHGAGPYR
jgi:enoyl-CoA hydratase